MITSTGSSLRFLKYNIVSRIFHSVRNYRALAGTALQGTCTELTAESQSTVASTRHSILAPNRRPGGGGGGGGGGNWWTEHQHQQHCSMIVHCVTSDTQQERI